MRILTILICLIISVNAFSQNFKFGKVSKEELIEKEYTIDSTANAAYLYKYRKTYFEYNTNEGFQLKTSVHQRIKIYNQEGFDYGTKEILLYRNERGNKEEVSNIKAFTYNLEDGKVVSVKLEKGAIFDSEDSKYLKKVKFAMPNLKPGSVIEFKYEITSPFTSNVDEFIFQHDIPVKQLKAIFEVPEYYTFKMNPRGFTPIIPKKESSIGSIVFSNKTRASGGMYSAQQRTSYSTSKVDFTKEINTYELRNIKALKDEPYVNSINNYRSSVKYELSYRKFPQSNIEYFSTTWEDVVKNVYKSSSFGEELNKTGYFANDINSLIDMVSDPKKKVEIIFDFVKSQVKWNGYYGFYSGDGVRKAYKEHVGNSGDINLMLTAMLRHAGLNSNPVLISTRTHGIPLFPTREGFNYVVCWVKLTSGEEMLLDATSKYAVPNVLPFRTLNWQGRIVADNGGSSLIDLYPKTKSKNSITLMAKIDEEGALEGNYRSTKTNHSALSFRNKYNEADKEAYLEKLENKYNGIEISDYDVKNPKDLVKPIIESYKFVKESQADIIGDKMYFSPLFYLKTNENPFKLDKREFPVDFGYPSTNAYRLIINIPEGYKIESLPESVVLGLPDNLGTYQFKVAGSGNTIQVSVVANINQAIILPVHYSALKEYFNKFIQKEAEQIVLTKV